MEVFMHQITFFVLTLLIFPSICIGEMDSKKQRVQNQVTYEEAHFIIRSR